MTNQTRREFLSALGRVGSAAAVAGSLGSIRAWAQPMGLPAGIQLYTVRDVIKADAPGALRQLYDIGYREVESAGLGKITAKEMGRWIKDAGLLCPSAHLPLSAADPGPIFEDAHALGASYATSSSLQVEGPANGQVWTPASLDDFKRLASLMNGIGAKAKAAGLTYAYHNHKLEFVKMPDGSFGYDVLLHETDPAIVKFEIDCGWMVMGGASPVDYMRKYPHRIRMIHVKDFKAMPREGAELEGSELGAGIIDYKPIFTTGKAIGIQHAFAEQEGPYTKPEMDSARIDFAYLRSMK